MPHDSPRDHPFAPPPIPTEVCCMHCGQVYESWQMQFVPSTDGTGGDWVCPTAGCDGVGFCLDIWPTDPDWTDEFGERVCFSCDDDAELQEETGHRSGIGDYDQIEDDDGEADLLDILQKFESSSADDEMEHYGLIDDEEVSANWGSAGRIGEGDPPRINRDATPPEEQDPTDIPF